MSASKPLLPPLGLTYDDVLLVPLRSSSASRVDADLNTHLTRNIKLSIPLVSANMDTVTESAMALSLAKLGGIGIIHRFLPIEKEADEVALVKRAGKFLVGAAVGVRDDALSRTTALVNAGVDVVVVDIAHGHADHMIRTIVAIKKAYPTLQLIAGNVATAEGASDLIKAGADAVKVGVGPGALCTTRVVTGCGVPQLTAVMNAGSVAKKYKVPVIADGGVKTSGDVTKALAAGADSVMIGTLFAGCDESPGIALFKNGGKYKLTRGMASLDANRQKWRVEGKDEFGLKDYVAEGVEALVPCRGVVADIVNQLLGGLRSGMSYCGSKTIRQLHKKAEFVRITAAGLRESGPHDVHTI